MDDSKVPARPTAVAAAEEDDDDDDDLASFEAKMDAFMADREDDASMTASASSIEEEEEEEDDDMADFFLTIAEIEDQIQQCTETNLSVAEVVYLVNRYICFHTTDESAVLPNKDAWIRIAQSLTTIWLKCGYDWFIDKRKRLVSTPGKLMVTTNLCTTTLLTIFSIEHYAQSVSQRAPLYQSGAKTLAMLRQCIHDWSVPREQDAILQPSDLRGEMAEHLRIAHRLFRELLFCHSDSLFETKIDPTVEDVEQPVGMRYVNELAFSIYAMHITKQTVCQKHKLAANPFLDEIFASRNAVKDFRDLIFSQAKRGASSDMELIVRQVAMISQAKPGCRAIACSREEQDETTMDPSVAAQQIHSEFCTIEDNPTTEWLLRIGDPLESKVFGSLRDPFSHPVRPTWTLVLFDSLLESFNGQKFLRDFVVFDWDLQLKKSVLYEQKRKGDILQRRPVILYTFGQFYVQTHVPGRPLPLLYTCSDVEEAILTWMYLICKQFRGVFESGRALQRRVFPFAVSWGVEHE